MRPGQKFPLSASLAEFLVLVIINYYCCCCYLWKANALVDVRVGYIGNVLIANPSWEYL